MDGYRSLDRWTDRYTDTQIDRWMDGWTDRLTEDRVTEWLSLMILTEWQTDKQIMVTDW